MWNVSLGGYTAQIVAALAAILPIMSCGMANGWTSPVLAKITTLHHGSGALLTFAEASWLVVAYNVGMCLVPFPASMLMNRFGRKRTLLYATMPAIIGWTLLASVDVHLIIWCLARFLIGLTNGAAYITTPVYLSEITAPRVRGACGLMSVMATKLGLVLVYAIGAHVPLSMLSVAGAVPLLLFGAVFLWMPETPYHHLCHGRAEKARETLRQLRRSKGDAAAESALDAELDQMQALIADTLPSQRQIVRQLWQVPANRRSMRLLLVHGAGIALCGSQAINSYAQVVFEVTGKNAVIGPANSAILTGCVQLAFASVSSAFADTVGRRPLVLASVAGTMACNAIVAGCIALMHSGGLVGGSTAVAWTQLVATVLFFAFFVVGLSGLFGVLFAELFPTNLRCTAAAIITTHGALWSAIVGKMFQVISDRLGSEYAFGTFAGCGALVFVYMWLELEETKGKSLEQIQKDREAGQTLAEDGV